MKSFQAVRVAGSGEIMAATLSRKEKERSNPEAEAFLELGPAVDEKVEETERGLNAVQEPLRRGNISYW